MPSTPLSPAPRTASWMRSGGSRWGEGRGGRGSSCDPLKREGYGAGPIYFVPHQLPSENPLSAL